MTHQYWGDEPHDPMYHLGDAPRPDPHHPSDLTCIHQQAEGLTGLCGPCVEAYDTDPVGYFQYGDHTEGIAAYEALQREIAQYHARGIEAPCFDPDDIPF